LNAGGGLSVGAKAGIGVGAAIGALALLFLAYWLGRRHSRKSRGEGEENDNSGATANTSHAPVPPYELHGTKTGHELEGQRSEYEMGAEKAGMSPTSDQTSSGYPPPAGERAELEAINKQWTELDARMTQKNELSSHGRTL
jgi:hypothetical protein